MIAADTIKSLLARAEKAEAERDEAYMSGVKKAIYEIMKEADIPGSNEIRSSGDSDDGMCALVAERIRVVIAETQRRERAAVEDLRTVAIFNNSCGFCGKYNNCKNHVPGRKTVEPCWQWRGPRKDGEEKNDD